jgi:hypothetical protein
VLPAEVGSLNLRAGDVRDGVRDREREERGDGGERNCGD